MNSLKLLKKNDLSSKHFIIGILWILMFFIMFFIMFMFIFLGWCGCEKNCRLYEVYQHGIIIHKICICDMKSNHRSYSDDGSYFKLTNKKCKLSKINKDKNL